MKIIKYLSLFCILGFQNINFAKILIFTHSYNRPDFIKIQHDGFKKFLLDDYEFIVFNDATDNELYNQIHSVCKSLKLKCIDIPQEIHTNGKYQLLNTIKALSNASIRNCNVVRYSLDVLGFNHDDILAIIDSDMFLVKKFSIKKHLKEHDTSAWMRPSRKIKYFWIGLVFLDMKNLPNKNQINFSCGYIDKALVDSGGFTYKYLKENPSVKNLEINKYQLWELFCNSCMKKKGRIKNCTHNADIIKQRLNYNSDTYINFVQNLYTGPDNRNVEFFLNGTFIHYRAGSGYNKKVEKKYIHTKNMNFKNFFDNILK